MLDSSSPNLLRASGVKRLLPAFEPSSSPPRFKRQKPKTVLTGSSSATTAAGAAAAAPAIVETENRYPTPLPSSSIGNLPSSPPSALAPAPPPPPPVQAPASRRPLLKRSQSASTVSERLPLAAVPSIPLPASGEPVLLGRSSNSSHYRLSANRLISRVHIQAAYIPATPAAKPKIELRCLGWNGVKVHCQGRAWDLMKDDVFVSESEHAEIMLDVHDSRVVLAWPASPSSLSSNIPHGSPLSGTGSGGATAGRAGRSPSLDWEAANDENADPWETAHRVNARPKLTPVSPSPRPRRLSSSLAAPASAPSVFRRPSVSMAETVLDIYEDEPEEADPAGRQTLPELPPLAAAVAAAESFPLASTQTDHSDDDDDHDDHDDCHAHVAEPPTDVVPKDDIALSFGSEPHLPPMSLFSTAEALRAMAAIPLASSPPCPPSVPSSSRRRPRASSSPLSSVGGARRTASVSPNKNLTLQNHLTNQLAFSRVNTMPLTELYNNLPVALAAKVTKERVKEILLQLPCIGEIKRVGKDAAGKPLEHQYYYVMEHDKDEGRKAAVGGKAGMRTCRKTHKVCPLPAGRPACWTGLDAWLTVSSNTFGRNQRSRRIRVYGSVS